MAGGKESVIVEVMYPYSAAETNQITLLPNEKITVLEKDKSGWWIGKRSTGEVGIFPSTYVKPVEDRLKFNRPKEMKPLPLSTPSGKTQANDRDKKWKMELGLDSDSAGDDKESGEKRSQKTKMEVAKMKRSLDSLQVENGRLRDAALTLEKEKEKAVSEASTVRTQLSVLKRQIAAAHEKERRLEVELDDWKAVSKEGDNAAPKPREYKDEPDEALQRWLDAATQDKLRSANDKIAKLEAEVEVLQKQKAARREEDFDDDDSDMLSPGDEKDDKEEKEREKKRAEENEKVKKEKTASPSPSASPTPDEQEVRERPDKHDVVKLSEAANDKYGALKPGETGTVVEDQGVDSPMPFRVRNAQGEDTWYTEHCLVVVSRGKRKTNSSPKPEVSPKANGKSSPDPQLKDELKEKTKRIKKLEKKQQVLEEDLEALEKYNTKLEKRLEKEKAKTKAGGGGDNEALLQEIADLKEQVAAAGTPAPAADDQAKAKVEQLMKEVQELKDAGGSSAELLMVEKEKRADLEAQMAELKASAAEGAEAVEGLNQANMELKASQQTVTDMTERLSAAEAKATQASAESEKAVARCAEIEGQMSTWVEERDKLRAEASSAVQQLEANTEQLKIAVGKYQKEEKRRRELYNQLIELKGNIRVYCRVKPCPEEESDSVTLEDDMTVRIKDPQNGKIMNYEFDKCFEQTCTQLDVFEEAKGLAVSVLDGYYVCIFAYGQTGSGKTYTMEGPEHDRGVNFRTVSELFRLAQEREADYTYSLQVSVLEVYNDKIYDLQNKRSMVKVTPASKGERDVTITPLTRLPVTATDQVISALEDAYVNRKVAGTSMNEHSSRSHCVLSVWITATNKNTGQTINGKLHLVDLAGSERLKQSEAEGEQKVEATHINKSLTQLGLCINSLANKKDHIPFRNSQLTTLLADSLGGNCKCLMFANISPKISNIPETVSTLKFATNARKVELGKATKNVK